MRWRLTETTRPALPADRELVRELHHAAFRDVVERQFGRWSDAEQARFFAAQWDRGGIELILWNGTPAGYCDIEDRPDDVYVHVLAIHPRAQGRGIGSAVLQRAIERAESRGVPVRLQVLRENRAAELYRRIGFEVSGQTPTHFLMEWQDLSSLRHGEAIRDSRRCSGS